MTAEGAARPLHIGFACSWWHPWESTWSYTPVGLWHALSERPGLALTSIEAQRPLAGKAAMRVAYRYSETAWQHGRPNRWLTQHKIHREAGRAGIDVVLAMSMTEPELPVPTYFYQDMGYSVVNAYNDRTGHRSSNLGPVSASRLRVLVEEESVRYGACTGIFTMSQWFARWLTDIVGVPTEKVHPVGGGLNAARGGPHQQETPPLRRRLLFIGRDFWRKGGDVVVEAVAKLRQSGSGDYRLTVVGPPTWPLGGEPPAWVDFCGSLTPAQVGRLWAEHDVFVLPSRFEAFGLTFLEARAAGLPCVGRAAFAMPELVPPEAGALVPEDGGAEELAAAIHSVSSDDALAERVLRDAPLVARENSWQAVAGRMLDVIRPGIGDTRPDSSAHGAVYPITRAGTARHEHG